MRRRPPATDETSREKGDQNDLRHQTTRGFELIGNYNNQYVIAKNEHPGAPEPYVVWAVDYDKRGVHSGTYFPSLQMAQLSFCERAFGTNLMQDHESTEEHLLYAVANDDIKAAVKAVRELERQSSFSESAERPMTETKLHQNWRIMMKNCLRRCTGGLSVPRRKRSDGTY